MCLSPSSHLLRLLAGISEGIADERRLRRPVWRGQAAGPPILVYGGAGQDQLRPLGHGRSAGSSRPAAQDRPIPQHEQGYTRAYGM